MTTAVQPKYTRKEVLSWSIDELRKHMKDPEDMTAVNLALQTPEPVEPTAEEKAEQERIAAEEVARKAAEDKAAADRAASEKAEADRKAAEAVRPKRFVEDYDVQDEQGNVIAHTHLEASSEEELRKKIRDAHVHATRAFHRMKGLKVTKETPAAPVEKGMTDEQLTASIQGIKDENAKKVFEDLQAKLKAERAASEKEAQERDAREGQRVANEFMALHQHDFLPCKANSDLIGQFLADNNLPWTVDNLEFAFTSVSSKLAPVPKPAPTVQPSVEPAPVNPPAAAPANAPAAAVPAPAPAPAAPAPAPAAAAPAAPVVPEVQPQPSPAPAPTPANTVVVRHVPAGDLQPGSLSGVRPAQGTNTGLSMQEIMSWDGQTMRDKMRNPTTKAQIEKTISEYNKTKNRSR